MSNDAPAAATKHVALDPVAAHFKRKADFFENEALLAALQMREVLARPPAPIEQAGEQPAADEERG